MLLSIQSPNAVVSIPSSSGQVFITLEEGLEELIADIVSIPSSSGQVFISFGKPHRRNSTPPVSIPSSSGQVFIRDRPPGGGRGMDCGSQSLLHQVKYSSWSECLLWVVRSLSLNPFFIRSSIHPEDRAFDKFLACYVSIPSSSGQVFIGIAAYRCESPCCETSQSLLHQVKYSSYRAASVLGSNITLSQSLLHQVKYSSAT